MQEETARDIADALEEQNRLLGEIADALEDRVKQEGLKHGLELGADSETGRSRQL